MGSILNILIRNPKLCNDVKLRFKDTRQCKGLWISTSVSDRETSNPLDDLFHRVVKFLAAKEEAGELIWPPDRDSFDTLPAPPSVLPVQSSKEDALLSSHGQYSMSLLFDASPEYAVSNYGKSQQTVAMGPLDTTALEANQIDVPARLSRDTKETMRTLCGDLFGSLKLAEMVAKVANTPVSADLPFDADRHPHAQSTIAKSTLRRLKNHVKIYAECHNKKLVSKIPVLEVLADPEAEFDIARDQLKSVKVTNSQMKCELTHW